MKKHHPFFLLLLALTGCQVQPSLPTVPEFELSRYLGKWYETARLDHSFERGMSEVSAHYSLNEDGTVKVINSGIRDGKRRSITGVAKTAKTPGELRVSFFRPFYGSYRVVALTPDYSLAMVVSGNSRKYLWILSRTPEADPELVQQYLELARSYGFDTGKIIFP